MADNGKVVINLTTGHEDADKVTVAFRRCHGRRGKAAHRGDVPHQGGGPPGTARLRRGDRDRRRSARQQALRSVHRGRGPSSTYARSASTLANSTATISWPTRRSRAQPRSGTTSARAPRSSRIDQRGGCGRANRRRLSLRGLDLGDVRLCELPFGPAVFEAPRRAARVPQAADGVVGVGAERAAAVGHHLSVGRQLGKSILELFERDRSRILDVASGELLSRAARRRAPRRRGEGVRSAPRGRSPRLRRRGIRGPRARPPPGAPPTPRAARATAPARHRRRGRSARACPHARA